MVTSLNPDGDLVVLGIKKREKPSEENMGHPFSSAGYLGLATMLSWLIRLPPEGMVNSFT